MLSIFNNGSFAWIILILLIVWTGFCGYKFYKSHKSGYHRQLPGGGYEDTKPLKWYQNNWFKFWALGAVLLTGFMLLINGDYK